MLLGVHGALFPGFSRGLLPRGFRGVILLSAFSSITFLCHSPSSQLQLSFFTLSRFFWLRDYENEMGTLSMVFELKKKAAASDVTNHSLLFSSSSSSPRGASKVISYPPSFHFLVNFPLPVGAV